MTLDEHSIWLMPRADDETRFATIVHELAERFDSPIFRPHLTLVEDMPRSCDRLVPLLDELALGEERIVSAIEAVDETPLYFRSLYARFAPVPALMALKRKAVGIFGVGSLDSFVPHISLAYGVSKSADKAASVSLLQAQLAGLEVEFDRVCIVSSSQGTPIDRWEIKAERRLSQSTREKRNDASNARMR